MPLFPFLLFGLVLFAAIAGFGFERVNAILQASGVDLRALRSDLRRTALRGPLEIALTREAQSVDGTLAQADMTLEVARRAARGESGEQDAETTLWEE